MYYDFFVYTHEVFNFERPFEITSKLVNSVNKDLLLGYNFNRYTNEGNDNRHHFTIRLNLIDTSQIPVVLAQLAQLQNNGIIDTYTNNNQLVNIPFNNMSMNHHLSHETSTKCAFEFYNKSLISNRFKELWVDPITFLTLFLPRWLKYSGYNFNGVGNILPTNAKCIEELGNDCSIIVKQVDRNKITDFATFTERLIHTLFNCLSNLEVEWLAKDTVAYSLGYNDYEALLKDLTM